MNRSGLSGNAVSGHVHLGRAGTNGVIICDLAPLAATCGVRHNGSAELLTTVVEFSAKI